MSLIKETDYGTPESKSSKLITLTIDGQSVTVPEGTSIMRAAMEIGTEIPKLCATDSIKAFGSCRLCLIEIEGRNGTPASCTTPVMPGISVHTQTPRLKAIRRGVMELYISDHPLDCLTCAANGDCELQDMAGAVGLREVRYGYDGANHVFARNNGSANFEWMPKDESNPYFTYDPSKCIVCNRCVRACEEVQGTFALTISGRGFDSRVSPGMSEAFFESECVSCGACVQACPTATLTEKSVIEVGQPEHAAVTTCAYCGVGCTFKAEMRGEEVVRMTPWKDGKANHGHSCIKGRFAYGYATHRERLLKPMIRDSIHEPWRVVSWDEAIGFTARRFKEIQAKYGKDSVGVITSSRCTNEESYLVQKLARAGFGNNNTDTCARVCHSPTGYGLNQAFGTSAGTQDFDSVDEADVIVVIGANPTDAHPVFGSRMKARLREGAKLIIVDPRRIDLVRSPHIEADYSSAAETRHQCRRRDRDGACDRHRRPRQREIRARTLRLGRVPGLGRLRRRGAQQPRAKREIHRSSGRRPARGRAALRHRRQCGDLLRPWRDRAQPGLHDRHGHRQSRHGDRQSRPSRRRRESAARPEQCAGLLRHGFVPARTAGLSAYFERRRAGGVRGRMGRQARSGTRPAHPQYVRRRRRRHFQGPLRPRRGHSPVRSRHQACLRRPRRDGAGRGAGSVFGRDGQLRPCLLAGLRRSSKRTAPSPTPNAASSACAR